MANYGPGQPSMNLFPTTDPRGEASRYMGMASNSAASMMKKGPEAPGKTVGGGVMNAVGGATAAASLGAAMGTGATAGFIGGPPGIAIGAAIGLGAYLLS